MILLAIAPVIPIFILLGTIGGLFALLRGKSAKAGELPKPTPDPSGRAVPYITVATGSTTARLEKKGGTWTYDVKGPVPATGGSGNAGAAAIEMVQAVAASAPDGAIVGEAGSATNPALTFGVQKDGDLWDWTVMTKDPVPVKVPNMVPKIEMRASGFRDERSDAFRDVISALADYLDWLDVPAFDGAGAPDAPTTLPGIVIAGKTVAIINLDEWLAFMAPKVREAIVAGNTADEILDGVFGDDDGWILNGKELPDVRKHVQETMDKVHAGDYMHIVAPDVRIAAQLVGAAETQLDKHHFYLDGYKGHVILVRPARVAPPAPGNLAIQQGKRFEFLIWAGSARGFDDATVDRGTMGAGKTKSQAARFAKQRVDQNFPQGTGDDGGNTSSTASGDYEPPPPLDPIVGVVGTIKCGPGQHFDAAQGKCVDTEELVLEGEVARIDLPPVTWLQEHSREVLVFDFATGSNRARRDWTIGIGVCLYTDAELPFGSLSAQFNDTINVNYLRFQIRQIRPGKNSAAIKSFASFRDPTFKEQFRAKFERGVPVNMQQVTGVPGLVPSVKMTKALDEIDGEEAERLDACAGRAARWPTPKDPGFIVHEANAAWKDWRPVPKFALIARGSRLILRITYTGFPSFADQEGGESPALAFPSNLKLVVRVRATGNNA